MLITGLKPYELAREVISDMRRLDGWIFTQHSSFQRWLASNRKAEWYATQWKSPNHNLWKVMLHTFGFKEKMEDRYIAYTLVNGRYGRYLVRPMSGSSGFFLIIYIPHFFKRYRQRMNLGDKLKPEQLMRRYMRNNITAYNVGDNGDVEIVTEEGIALGYFIFPRLMFVKTFITHEMSKGDQIERYGDGLAKVHDDKDYPESDYAQNEIRDFVGNLEDYTKRYKEFEQKHKQEKENGTSNQVDGQDS